LNLEIRAGKSREDALRNLAARTGIEDIHSLVTLLIQADKFGTSIAQSLRVFSDSFRTNFPSLFVVLLGPAAIRIYQVILRP